MKKPAKKKAAKRSGTVPDLAAAEELCIYAGNSALADEAYARAEAWARGDTTVYAKAERGGKR